MTLDQDPKYHIHAVWLEIKCVALSDRNKKKILVLAENEENISLGWKVLAWLTASQLDKTKIQHLKLQSLHYEFLFLYWDGIVY